MKGWSNEKEQQMARECKGRQPPKMVIVMALLLSLAHRSVEKVCACVYVHNADDMWMLALQARKSVQQRQVRKRERERESKRTTNNHASVTIAF